MAQAPRRRPNPNRVDWGHVGAEWLHFFMGHPVRAILTAVALIIIAAAINPDGVGSLLGTFLGNVAAALVTALGNALTALLVRLQPYFGVLVVVGFVYLGFRLMLKPLRGKPRKKH